MPAASAALTRAEVAQFAAQGWVGPFRAMPPREVERVQARLRDTVLAGVDSQASERLHCRHLDIYDVFELCALPAIVHRIACLLGPDLQLWRTHLWAKQPGEKGVAWHQDMTYWPLEPRRSISAWLALDPATTQNGCVRAVPGTHLEDLPTAPLTGNPVEDSVDLDQVDVSNAVDLVLEPGEFFLFSERLLHCSGPNRTNAPRVGLTIRVIDPGVRVEHDRLLDGRHRNIQLLGTDEIGHNRLDDPPRQQASRGR